MTNEQKLALARNKQARLETDRRHAWDAGDEQQVVAIDAMIAENLARIAALEAQQ